MTRQPAVAGQFYSEDPMQLRAELGKLVNKLALREKVLGIIAPHAGYVYSGMVAGEIYGAVEMPQVVIVLGPNHHGLGSQAALYPDGDWQTPLGRVPINSRLAGLVKKHVPFIEDDTSAHQYEHSLEVQIPFFQYVNPAVSIVPLCLGFSDYASCRLLGEGIGRAVIEFGEQVLIVASSDMTHYESAAEAARKDQLAINEILALNPEGLLRVCRELGITMCGVIPAVVMLVAARMLGATSANLIRYATSGDVTGDKRQVVGYAALTVVA